MTGSIHEGVCWNCGTEQTTVFGGKSNRKLIECEECGVIVAETGYSYIIWADNAETSERIIERNIEEIEMTNQQLRRMVASELENIYGRVRKFFLFLGGAILLFVGFMFIYYLMLIISFILDGGAP